MSGHDRDLAMNEKGYFYYCGCDSNEEAKAKAKSLRESGRKARVFSESRRGVYYYSVYIGR